MDVLLSWPSGSWQASTRLIGGMVFAYLLVIWLASILWVYRDIRSRTTDPTSHIISVAIAVVFPIFGLPIYLILRPSDTLTAAYDRQLEQEALLSELQTVSACPNCRRPVQDEFTVCAFCATPVKQACSRCGRQLRLSWRFCPYCSTSRGGPPVEPRSELRSSDEGQGAVARASSTAASRVEAIRRAATGSRGDSEEPRARRPAADGGPQQPQSRPRPRPKTDGER